MTASLNTAPPPAVPADAFPGESALCEACGYPLKGLHPAGHCPECGSAVADSHPAKRSGLAFERAQSIRSYIRSVGGIFLHPKRTYRTMSIAGSNVYPRQFLLVNAILAATLWLLAIGLPVGGEADPLIAWLKLITQTLYGLLGLTAVFFGVIVGTYIEVLGVTWFSRRRGWRVPLPLAERVACYASIGWLPGAAVLGVLINLARHNLLQDLWIRLGGPGPYAADAVWVALFFVGVLGMLGFETLVWVGVRQVKFANRQSL